VVEPLGVILKAGVWYFIANRRGRPAMHRLDGVAELALLDETFERPAGFDLATVWAGAVEGFQASLRRETAALRAGPEAMARIDLLGADMADPLRAARPDASGVREAEVAIESVDHAAGLLIGFGAGIEVLAPAALRAELRRRAADIAALYAGDD
jgi:predicted DNA-binding transcriptional regulator YafY